MRFFLHVRHTGILRHYGGVIAELGRLGHQVTVMAPSLRGATEEPVAHVLAGDLPGVTVVAEQIRVAQHQTELIVRLRWVTHVLRYEHPDYAGGSWLRSRAWDLAPPGVARWARLAALGGWPLARAALRAARAIDRIVPPPAAYGEVLDAVQPDVVLVSPVVAGTSTQIDLLKAATRRGLPTAILIPSWDNLTTKGLVGYVPDEVYVWNDFQRAELERLHDVRPRRIVVTGAPTFDHWFEQNRGLPRETFLARVGLDPERAYILYLGSSLQMAPGEPDFFVEWLEVLQSSPDKLLRDVQVLIRPHPHAIPSWMAREFDLSPGLAVWPQDAEAVSRPEYYADYENSLRHCAAVVGLNTSSMIEAAIFGKAVCTWEAGSLGRRQRETLHYHYLGGDSDRAGVHVARDAPQHLEQLAAAVRAGIDGIADPASASFVDVFVRPCGRDLPVSPLMAAELVALGSAPTSVSVPGAPARLVGHCLAWLHFPLGLPLADHPLRVIAVRASANAIFLRARMIGVGARIDERRRRRRRARQLALRAAIRSEKKNRHSGKRAKGSKGAYPEGGEPTMLRRIRPAVARALRALRRRRFGTRRAK